MANDKPAPRTNLENMTFTQLAKALKLYDEATNDETKLYHVSSAMSILSGLRSFLAAKTEIFGGKTIVPSADDINININVTGKSNVVAPPKKDGE